MHADETAAVDQATAQALFDALPAPMRWPTLSPAYVAADALRDAQAKPVFLVSGDERGFLMHAVHEMPIAGLHGCDWQSAYGYGGPIVRNLDAAGLARAWDRLDGEAAARRVVAEFVRFHPMAENHRHYPGTVREDRAVVAIDLTAGDLLANYSGRARTAIRKAERDGLRAVTEPLETSLAHFPRFYRRCMREIGADDFYLFSDAYFESMLRLPGARVLSVTRENERLCMGVFLFGPQQAEYHLSGTLMSARQSCATNLLLHAAAQAARESGCLTFFLGGGTNAEERNPLLRFKMSFAPTSRVFRVGHRIHDPAAYEALRAREPERAAGSKRILFYRR